MDKLSPAVRSRVMAAVRGKNTRPEMIVRSLLHRLGLRFRLHDKKLPGTPDIVLAKHKTVVFVHGCFWHCHRCSRGAVPKSRAEFWLPKLAANKARDSVHRRALVLLGWRVVTVWECETKQPLKLTKRLVELFAAPTNEISNDKR